MAGPDVLACSAGAAPRWGVRFVDSGAARLAYTVQGHGPTVLLLHAGVTDQRSWEPLIGRLGNNVQTIAYDRRGFGQTTYQPEAHLEMDDAIAVLEAEQVRAAVVIGASNGGRRAIDLALAHPDRVEALLLIAAGVSGAPEEDPSIHPPRVQELYRAYEVAEHGDDVDELNRIEAHAWLDGWAADEGRVSGPTRRIFLEMNGIALRAATPGPEQRVDPAWDRLGEIEVPTVVLCGDLDVVCTSASEHLAASIPGAQYEVLLGTGHLPHFEGHERTLEVISAFVAAQAG